MPASSEEFLDIQATIECGFNLKRVCDMIKHTIECTVMISTQNTAQSSGQFYQMVECFFTN